MAVHTMLDLETLSLEHNALLLSIGAVKFTADAIVDKFHVGILPIDAQRYGLHIDAGTVMWWLDPAREAARASLVTLPKVDLFAALDGFGMWLGLTPDAEQGSLWGNGAIMDISKINAAYKAVGLNNPVNYKREECYRTMKNRLDPKGELFERIGVEHDAVDDAASQAVHLQKICAKFGIEL